MKKNPEIEFTFDGFQFNLAEYDYISGTPGYLSGPPEKCYPPEPAGLEVIKLLIEDFSPESGGWKEIPERAVVLLLEFHEGLWDTILDRVENALRKEEPEYEPRDFDSLD